MRSWKFSKSLSSVMFFGKGSSVLIPGFDSFLLRDANSTVSRLKWGAVTVLPMNLCGPWRTPPARALSSFETHARCSPKRKALDLDDLTEKKRTVNSLSYTVNNLISPNKISQNDEKPHTAELDDTAIPHVKIKITEIPPCPPPYSLVVAQPIRAQHWY